MAYKNSYSSKKMITYSSKKMITPGLVRRGAHDATEKSKSTRGSPNAHLRKWLRIDTKGALAYVTVTAANPTAVLIREKALVVHLESIRMIICKDQILLIGVPMPGQPSQSIFPAPDSPLVQDLVTRIGQFAAQQECDSISRAADLPYEFLALEVALSAVCKSLDVETSEVDTHLGPALDNLAHKVCKKDLEDVRNLKSRLNRVHARTGKVKQVIEAILDDDDDMQDMYLGRRAAAAAVATHQEEAVNPDNYNEQRPPESPFDTDDHAEMTQNVEPIAEWPLDDYRQTKNPQTASSAAEVSMSGTEGESSLADLFASLRPELENASSGEDGRGVPPVSLRRISEGGVSIRERASGLNNRILQQSLSRNSAILMRTRRLDKNSLISRRVTAPDLARNPYAGPELSPEEMQTIVWTRDLNKVDPRDIEACEDLLDAYFLMVDATLTRLSVLKERIDATEALITIHLDSRRNDLVAFDLVCC